MIEQGRKSWTRGLLWVLMGWGFIAAPPAVFAQDAEQEESARKASAAWKARIDQHLAANPALKAITDKHGYFFIHSKTKFETTNFHHCAYNFVYSTADESVHKGNVHLVYHHLANPMSLEVNANNGSNNLIADLGASWDFAKDCDVSSIRIDGDLTWLLSAKAVQGHTYVIRIRDSMDNRLFVLLKVVYVDPRGEYVAFAWRKMTTKNEKIQFKTPG